jgi:hypothetical protein
VRKPKFDMGQVRSATELSAGILIQKKREEDMKRQYQSIINWLRAAIKNEDVVTAVEIAKQLLPLRDQIRIEADPPVFYYRGSWGHCSLIAPTSSSPYSIIRNTVVSRSPEELQGGAC